MKMMIFYFSYDAINGNALGECVELYEVRNMFPDGLSCSLWVANKYEELIVVWFILETFSNLSNQVR